MSRRWYPGILWAVVLGGLAVSAGAQDVQIRALESRDDGAVYELTAGWPSPLRAALDSVGAQALTQQAVLATSRGLLSVSEKLDLTALALPGVRVLAADFDEVTLAATPEVEAWLPELTRPAAEAGGLGLERKKPAATLLFRLLTYDAGRQALRRYRRVVVAVDYARTAPARAAKTLATRTSTHLLVDRSVLADGIVYKIAIREEGLYQIDRAFLSALPGLEGGPGSIDPHTVQVFGNGGAPLPAFNGTPRPADLVENPVFVRGGGDGSFDNGDVVLFYANGPSGWQARVALDFRGEPQTDPQGNPVRLWEHYVNPFATENYYFIKIGAAESARVGDGTFPGFADATVASEILGRAFVDFDEFMWGREGGESGHTWVTDLLALGGASRVLLDNAALPGLASGTLRYEVRAAIQSNPAASLFFTSGGIQIGSALFGAVSNNPDNIVARSGTVTFEQSVSGGAPVNLSVQLENRGQPKAAVDWVRLFYPQALRPVDGVVRMHTPLGEVGRFEMVVSGFAQQPQVWDVTTPGTIQRLGTQASGTGYRVQVEVTDADQPRELIAFTEASARLLSVETACLGDDGCRVAAQNLHGLPTFPDFVIITPRLFRSFADELKARRTQEGLVVEVVDIEQVYNEFSGGLPDARAPRDFFKFLYDRAPDDASLLRYALFFGDGHFNYRNLGEEPALENWLLPFETAESFDPETSYTSDDYFGLLDDDEGRWPYTRSTWTGSNERLNERVDVGVGRFTVQTTQDAEAVMDKIRRYEDPSTFGAWRNRYLFLADDALNGRAATENDLDLHVQNADVVAELVERETPVINQKKIYGISYDRVYRNGWRIPEARQDILSAIRDGVLLINYSGHGGEEALAQEELFTAEDAATIQNRDRLPIFITATCSFGRWDRQGFQSGAEALLLNPDGGAVALMTTVRSVYTTGGISTLNVGLNYELNRQLFLREADGQPRRLGDVLRLTKNIRVGYEGNNRKFNLLGDPTLRLGLSPLNAVVQTVNNTPVAEQPAQLRALDRVTIAGEVQAPDGTLVAGFDGRVNLSIFDAKRRVPLPVQFYNDKAYYNVREDLIWRGIINVTGGRFTATFVVPKDISYSNLPGRISVYASSDQQQAFGFTENVVVGGSSDTPIVDDEGPEVDLFLGDENFMDGAVVSERPRVLVKLFDESGINTAGAGVGHEMLLVVDEDEQNALDIGDLYESEENSFQRGQVTFEFDEPLAPGPHTLSVRVWDVINNSTTDRVSFIVSDNASLALTNVFNYPNPTPGRTRFVFEHNQPVGTPARIQVRIYTLTGRPIRTLEQDDVLSAGPVQIAWDGRDDDFDRLAPGVYLYKVRVEVDGLDGARQVSEQIEKLALIR